MTEYGHPAAIRVRRVLAIALAALLAYASVVLLLSRRDVLPLPSLPAFITAGWPTVSGESRPAEPPAPPASEPTAGAGPPPAGTAPAPAGEPVAAPPAGVTPGVVVPT